MPFVSTWRIVFPVLQRRTIGAKRSAVSVLFLFFTLEVKAVSYLNSPLRRPRAREHTNDAHTCGRFSIGVIRFRLWRNMSDDERFVRVLCYARFLRVLVRLNRAIFRVRGRDESHKKCRSTRTCRRNAPRDIKLTNSSRTFDGFIVFRNVDDRFPFELDTNNVLQIRLRPYYLHASSLHALALLRPLRSKV